MIIPNVFSVNQKIALACDRIVNTLELATASGVVVLEGPSSFEGLKSIHQGMIVADNAYTLHISQTVLGHDRYLRFQ